MKKGLSMDQIVRCGRKLKAMEKAGHISQPASHLVPSKNGKKLPWGSYAYVDGEDYKEFEYAGKKYRIDFVAGCFLPFVFELR